MNFGLKHKFSTYSEDKPLLQKLGLEEFEGVAWQTIYLGKTRIADSEVAVEVTGAPAQFWKFEVRHPNEVINLNTGSGSFKEYLPAVELFAVHGLRAKTQKLVRDMVKKGILAINEK